MDIIDHGFWVRYTPDKPHENAPSNTMYVRREDDNVDWYTYTRGDNFREDSVKFAVDKREEGWVVGAATKDVTAIFPANFHVYEIENYTGRDPQAELGSKIFDRDNGFRDPKPIEDPKAVIDELRARLDALERQSNGDKGKR